MGSNSISIRQNIQKISDKKDEKNLNPKVSGPVNEFSIEQFTEAWTELAKRVKDAGRDSLYVTLTMKNPEIDSSYNITLQIDNKVQEQTIERERQDILEFLRKKLNNYAISLVTNIQEGKEDKALYTNTEKFKRLVEKNPNIITLQRKLNLDLEF